MVVGSTNVDMTVYVNRLPRPGETVGGGRFKQANGGKGANQAVAAARLGGDVLFVTCVGDDINGHALERCFAGEGIDTSAMKFSRTSSTGTALIYVSDDGENCIAVAPGANSELSVDALEALGDTLEGAEYVLLQLEIPSETVYHAVETASSAGTKVILNPAPLSSSIPARILSRLWLITPNATEAEMLTGLPVRTEEGARAAAAELISRGVKNVVITLGSSGSLVCTGKECVMVPARKVEAVDTVGAGDAFNGALVTALSEGRTLMEAARFATVAASISVTREGAQSGDPYRSEVDELISTFKL